MPRRNRAPSLHSGGFTLVELLLAVALLALLLAAVAFNFSSLQRGQALEQGASQFESLLRLARAHAALSGHNVLVALVPASSLPPKPDTAPATGDPDALALAVLAQPDPLRNPSLLVPIPGATALLPTLADLVQLEVQLPPSPSPLNDLDPAPLPNPSLSPTNTHAPTSAPDSPAIPTTASPSIQTLLTFHPDGSSNPATFTLISTDPEDPRRLQLSFDPISVSFQRRFFSSSSNTNEPVVAESDPSARDENPDVTHP